MVSHALHTRGASGLSLLSKILLLPALLSLTGLSTTPPDTLTLEAGETLLHVQLEGQSSRVELLHSDQILLTSPAEGLWSIATTWTNDWPTEWHHAHPNNVTQSGEWIILTGSIQIPTGTWELRDAYRPQGDLIECVRRVKWTGDTPAPPTTLSVRWQAPKPGAAALLPGICYHGNPSGAKTAYGHVATYTGTPGEELLCEEHRYPAPFASLEWQSDNTLFGAALHSRPSLAPHANTPDQWWSLGVKAHETTTELLLLSGPCSINGQRGFVKANQRRLLKYTDTYLNIPPGAVIEKTFYLQAYPVARQGAGFQTALRSAINLFKPFDCETLPTIDAILSAKYRFTRSRFHEDAESAGFRMYPHNNEYVMGWAGQSGAPGYALLVLADRLNAPEALTMAQASMDHLATSPFNENGFMVRYDPDKNRWYGQDPVSQGQGMENFARAINAGRKLDAVDTSSWETFLRKACDIHAARILHNDWRPKSTNEGFLVSPLCKGHALFGAEAHRRAAIKAAEHYAERHLDMTEPYWGGTLDARCEDKEGAWAGFQAFLAVYEMTGEGKYLRWAEHAMNVALTYTVLWDIDLPAGRLRDHDLKTRGWTAVSVQNQHLDVYGVVYTPEIYRMGQYLEREDLKKLAILMYRSCGQLIDPFGSQGEQLNQTNFAQSGNLDDVHRMRGTYSEGWTVYWITAHFLNAAAQFAEMGVLE